MAPDERYLLDCTNDAEDPFLKGLAGKKILGSLGCRVPANLIVEILLNPDSQIYQAMLKGKHTVICTKHAHPHKACTSAYLPI